MSVPKPVLTFVVGITGHRSARLPGDHLARIEQQLAEVFGIIEAECRIELDRCGEFYSRTAASIYLVSSLADGADALAVRQCPGSWTKIGLLPCPEDRYIEALKSTTSAERVEQVAADFAVARGSVNQLVILPEPSVAGSIGLTRSRDTLLRQIDVLVAVWDGSPPDRAGGTSDVVYRAVEAGIPVIGIAVGQPQRPWVVSNVGDASRELPVVDATTGPLADIVRRELGVDGRRVPSQETRDTHSTGADADDRLRQFLAEVVPADRAGATQDWTRFLDALPAQGGFSQRITQVLHPRFKAADRLATYYGQRYRRAYVWAYLLSVCAVAAALASFVLIPHEPHHAVPALEVGLAALELFFVILIVAIVRRGQQKRWHDRWLDYRALAETLRHLRFLAPLCQYEKRAYLEAAARPGASWMLWYFRATMRELGMPSGDLGPDCQRKVLAAIVPEELESQIKYHADNTVTLRRLHRWLHRMGDACFLAALGILVLFLCSIGVSWYVTAIVQPLLRIAPYITATTAFLPALGAAFAGIRFTGDFEGAAERSAQTGIQLVQLRKRYELALDRLDFDVTAGVVFESARIMAADINGWTSLYSRKHLTLPG